MKSDAVFFGIFITYMCVEISSDNLSVFVFGLYDLDGIGRRRHVSHCRFELELELLRFSDVFVTLHELVGELPDFGASHFEGRYRERSTIPEDAVFGFGRCHGGVHYEGGVVLRACSHDPVEFVEFGELAEEELVEFLAIGDGALSHGTEIVDVGSEFGRDVHQVLTRTDQPHV